MVSSDLRRGGQWSQVISGGGGQWSQVISEGGGCIVGKPKIAATASPHPPACLTWSPLQVSVQAPEEMVECVLAFL